uniref:Uncharacterized protein n=1 Tax=Sphaerodactylus townsendi TaxID=933632 RepID=A0ACB8FYW5_9SAUR
MARLSARRATIGRKLLFSGGRADALATKGTAATAPGGPAFQEADLPLCGQPHSHGSRRPPAHAWLIPGRLTHRTAKVADGGKVKVQSHKLKGTSRLSQDKPVDIEVSMYEQRDCGADKVRESSVADCRCQDRTVKH